MLRKYAGHLAIFVSVLAILSSILAFAGVMGVRGPLGWIFMGSSSAEAGASLANTCIGRSCFQLPPAFELQRAKLAWGDFVVTVESVDVWEGVGKQSQLDPENDLASFSSQVQSLNFDSRPVDGHTGNDIEVRTSFNWGPYHYGISARSTKENYQQAVSDLAMFVDELLPFHLLDVGRSGLHLGEVYWALPEGSQESTEAVYIHSTLGKLTVRSGEQVEVKDHALSHFINALKMSMDSRIILRRSGWRAIHGAWGNESVIIKNGQMTAQWAHDGRTNTEVRFTGQVGEQDMGEVEGSWDEILGSWSFVPAAYVRL